MKSLWYLIGTAILLGAIAGVIYGVMTHKEPGLLTVCWHHGQADYAGTCQPLTWSRKQLPLPYYIVPDVHTNAYMDSIVAGADLWNKEVGPVFRRTQNAAEAKVRVVWGATELGNSGGHTTHYGMTGPLNAEIVLTAPSDLHSIYRYAAHKFGHVLGLAHDEAPRSIMYPVQPGITVEMMFVLPSDHDKKLLRELYQ